MIYKLDDKKIRSTLLEYINSNNSTHNNTVIIEELDLCQGEARIDLAIINGVAKGIEIKSDKDTLDRLEYQTPIYNKIFDYIEIVVGKTHQSTIFEKVPSWWGISIVEYDDNINTLIYKPIRHALQNRMKEPMCVIQFLWKSEALSILNKRTYSTSFKNKSRHEIWKKIIDVYEDNEIYDLVYDCLKTRQNWRYIHQLASSDD